MKTALDKIVTVITESTNDFYVNGVTKELKKSKIKIANENLRKLEGYELEDIEKFAEKELFYNLLMDFHPEIINQKFGLDALIWTEMMTSKKTNNTSYPESLSLAVGKNKAPYMQNAHGSMIKILNTLDAQTLKRIYTFLEGFSEEHPTYIDADTIIIDSAIEETNPKNLPRYGFDRVFAKNGILGLESEWGNTILRFENKKAMIFEIDMDAPVGISLVYTTPIKDRGATYPLNIPSAVTSFIPANKDTLMIYQLQAISPIKIGEDGKKVLSEKPGNGYYEHYFPPALNNFDYLRSLVKVAESVARKFKFKKIGILSGNNNPNIGKEVNKRTFPLERALQIYDGTAKRLFYEQNDLDKNWYKKIG